MSNFSKTEIKRLLELLSQELQKKNIKGNLYLVGGAVMTLVHDQRESTRDIDALEELLES